MSPNNKTYPLTGTGRTSVDIGDNANLELGNKFCYAMIGMWFVYIYWCLTVNCSPLPTPVLPIILLHRCGCWLLRWPSMYHQHNWQEILGVGLTRWRHMQQGLDQIRTLYNACKYVTKFQDFSQKFKAVRKVWCSYMLHPAVVAWQEVWWGWAPHLSPSPSMCMPEIVHIFIQQHTPRENIGNH